MIDAIQILGDAEQSLRKIQHALRHEVSRRLLIDIESLLGSVRMLEIDTIQKDSEQAVTSSHRHD